MKKVVRDHLIGKGFLQGYDTWVYHGERISLTPMEIDEGVQDKEHSLDDIDGNASFNGLLELLKEAMPNLNIPESFNKTKAMIRDLGLDYKKIHACPNDCMLYWKEHENDETCSTCKASRWKEFTQVDSEFEDPKYDHKVPAKVLRHFPLIPRIQRLFMYSKTVEPMRWHDEGHSKDGKLRHPADGQAWKDFDMLHPEFASEPRNSEYTMLSLLIPGPQSPGNDIDVYLQPLIEKLKELWEFGVETYDASKDQTFQLRASLLWTISDYPGRKMCYMDHRVFLPANHPWRADIKSFNGKEEDRSAPPMLRGKTKDHVNARYDLKKMGIREELHPIDIGGGRVTIANASFSMNAQEKSTFCSVLKAAKLPDGSASNISKYFSEWFKTRALKDDVPFHLKALSRGPNTVAKRFSGYVINGYRFHTMKRDARRKTQNSGVTLVSLTESFASSKDENPKTSLVTYYGAINDIIELDYYGQVKFVLFKCDWFEAKEENYRLTSVNFNKKCYQTDPFVLASQVHQCFYVRDPSNENKHYVMKTVPRDLFNMGDQSTVNAEEGYHNDPFDDIQILNASNNDNEPDWVRGDIPAIIVDKPTHVMNEVENEDDSDLDDTLLDFMD
ncbi:hypothetical protein TSUD_401990 [Trifolium subterraneum]|uniref:DUF4216 domain-containing protein n=1 Tax=Trifolium subterraneum TaxID=3900 RepID=A0A2Z6P9S2_TRISU|nr:hypothetical protein TSUD_401990 [Trifolium subterraneum]